MNVFISPSLHTYFPSALPFFLLVQSNVKTKRGPDVPFTIILAYLLPMAHAYSQSVEPSACDMWYSTLKPRTAYPLHHF